MADAKIITYGELISATTDVIPDGADPAVLIEDTAGLDFLEIDTENEKLILAGGGATVEIENASPSLVLDNSTAENIDNGRESKIQFHGLKGDETATTLGELTLSHAGTGDDYHSEVLWQVNANGGATTLVDFMQAQGSDGTATRESVTLGFAAGASRSGLGNTIIGYNAGGAAESNQTIVGRNAGQSAASGCVYVGTSTGQSCTGDSNVAVGQTALAANGSAANCAALGYEALDTTTGNDNTAVGYQAGDTLSSGTQGVFIGSGSDGAATLDNQIAIGYGATASAANTIMMGNHRTTDMTMDCPPITIKQTSTSGHSFKIEHEGSSVQVVGLGEDGDAGWLQLQDSIGATVMKVLKYGSSHILNGTGTNFGIGDPSPNSNFSTVGHQSHLCTPGGSLITASHTVGIHSTALYDTSGGAVTATLPAVSGLSGRVYTFKLVTAGNNLVIDADGSETIDGAANYTTSVAKTAVTIQCDGVGWQIISEYTP